MKQKRALKEPLMQGRETARPLSGGRPEGRPPQPQRVTIICVFLPPRYV